MSLHETARRGRIAGLALVLALGGCGFRPLYATHSDGSSAAAGLRAVAIDLIPDRNGQILRNALLDRFYGDGGPTSSRYRLTIVEHSTEELLGIQRDNSATKARMDVTAHYVLVPAAITGKAGAAPPRPLLSGNAQSRVLYDINDDQYATLVGKQSAYQQGADDVADQIMEAVAAKLDEAPGSEAAGGAPGSGQPGGGQPGGAQPGGG